ncbi:hypothetical protein LCGC14_0245590 [marine sediment metagenome]|uniref:HTH arsR-type domain-containing protein n=1 Tax=marine sediment metagenome TaxID=412755 RepID=A0A0F9XAH7_9ZZZZ
MNNVFRQPRRKYIKIYMDVNPDLFQALNEPHIKVLRLILKQMNKEDNKWVSNQGNHLRIHVKLNKMPQSTIERHIKRLKMLKILIPTDDGRGVYVVNKKLMEFND